MYQIVVWSSFIIEGRILSSAFIKQRNILRPFPHENGFGEEQTRLLRRFSFQLASREAEKGKRHNVYIGNGTSPDNRNAELRFCLYSFHVSFLTSLNSALRSLDDNRTLLLLVIDSASVHLFTITCDSSLERNTLTLVIHHRTMNDRSTRVLRSDRSCYYVSTFALLYTDDIIHHIQSVDCEFLNS